MARPPESHPWKLPINIVPPTNGDDGPITPWNNLFFGPVGLYHLRQWLGVHPNHRHLYISNQHRFRSADLAWFASGTHKDGTHHLPENMFHPSFIQLHQSTGRDTVMKEERKAVISELQELVFDSATLWDRVSGGTTLVMHVNGAAIPGAPARPEYLKAHIYIPLSLIDHHPSLKQPIKDLVQLFLETIGTHTVERWTSAACKHLNYSLVHTGRTPLANPLAPGFPQPQTGSAYYTFLGQPASPLMPLTSPSSSDITPPPSPTSESSVSLYNDLQEDYNFLEEKYNKLLGEVASLRRKNEQLLEHNKRISGELENMLAHSPSAQDPPSSSPRASSSLASSQRLHSFAPIPTRVLSARPTSPHVTFRSAKTKTSSRVNPMQAYSPFGMVHCSVSSLDPKDSQNSTPDDPFDIHLHDYSMASGNNHYYNHAPQPRTKSQALQILIQTLDLSHLEEEIIVIRDFVPAEKHMSMLMGIGLSKEIANKIIYFFSPGALNIDFMEYFGHM